MDEPRYWVDAHANNYYTLHVEGLPTERPIQGLYGIADDKGGGYIAFTTSQDEADRIVSLLNSAA